MAISDWIDNREMTGFPTFSHKEVCEAFPALSPQAVSTELYRLGKRKRVQAVHKGFYTVVPMQFRGSGIVPPYNYVGQLFAHLGKPYYISLLSAGALNGAAHQRPQRLSVTTVLPRISISRKNDSQLFWCYRKEIPQALLDTANSDTGTLLYSNPELTAIDLVQYSQLVGGLSAAATVIAELAEKTDFGRQADELLRATTLPTLQRLGYILDAVLQESKAAEEVGKLIMPHLGKIHYRPLNTACPTDGAERDTKWKVIINQDIDPDEIW